MKPRKPPVRTCVACATSGDKKDFVRFVRMGDGDTAVDPSGKLNGRGAYVCRTSACFERAVSRKRFTAALRVTLREEDVERLRREFERLIEA
ncbi:MAG: YlxR family protein [Coriobacteriia bacterium]